jgi:formate dehydrogenase subunit delta
MNVANLIKMANQIGAFFEAMPDREQAVKDVANHILRNWEPRMRAELLAHLLAVGDGDLKPVLRDALPLLRAAGG